MGTNSTTQTNQKKSIAFSIYNKARAEARRRGDAQKIEALNKVLGNLVRDAYRLARVRSARITAAT